MRNKHTVVRIIPRRLYLGVMVEVDFVSTKRWVEVKVPWRMLNEQYEAVADLMGAEALRQMRERPDPAQDPLPGIG